MLTVALSSANATTPLKPARLAEEIVYKIKSQRFSNFAGFRYHIPAIYQNVSLGDKDRRREETWPT
jgi:hypothetical protein